MTQEDNTGDYLNVDFVNRNFVTVVRTETFCNIEIREIRTLYSTAAITFLIVRLSTTRLAR